MFLTRQHIRDGSRYYGPYTNTSVARTVLELIGKLYPLESQLLRQPRHLIAEIGHKLLRFTSQNLPYAVDIDVVCLMVDVAGAADEVVVAEAPEIEMTGVTFTIPRRGDKAKLLEVSERNARQNRLDDLKHLERHNPEERTDRLLVCRLWSDSQ